MINRQVFMVGGKQRRKGGNGRKKTHWLFFYRIAGRIQPLLFSESPPFNHATLSNYQV
ncbi:hypothetical protein [Aneurinibacillus migulanus]|uniref:hypothetical protein n=1 Tax=Aneurinibacillus migulanus TaxID=47500 RepID=UPI001F350FCA|nr:hypothetical protein [Aneurinibacillus migulanus]